jgi:hypothetical protein
LPRRWRRFQASARQRRRSSLLPSDEHRQGGALCLPVSALALAGLIRRIPEI